MSPKYGNSSPRSRRGTLIKIKNNNSENNNRGGFNAAPFSNERNKAAAMSKIPTVPEITLVSGISPYVRREQEKQAKNRKARFEEHMKKMEEDNYRNNNN